MNRMWVLLGVAALAGVACLGVGCKPGEPLAGFTADPTSGVAPLKVQFTDRSVVTRESTIAGWSWTFGDGGTSTEQHPEHTYAAAGNYTVSLTVTSSYGKTNVVTLAEYVKVVPAGEPPLPVPNVVGMVQADAEAAITGAGLVVGTVTEAHHATVPAGNVISQNPAAGVEVASGSAVSLVVSRGPQPVAVPDVVDMARVAAEAAITAAGLTAGTVTEEFSATVPAGNVIRQNPVAGTSVAPGSTVALVVSLGPEMITVPSVVGMSQSAAQAAITGAGLAVGTVMEQYHATIPAGQVSSQNPASGTELAPGSVINLVVSRGPWLGGDAVTILLPGNVPLELMRIPAGSFLMGSPDTEQGRSEGDREGPVHAVTIGYDFYMGKYEVTQGQWLAVMGSWPDRAPEYYGVGANYPAYYVSWDDAQAFITAVNAHITETGQGTATLRLPSEAEWEYACRAGTQTRFYFGDSLGGEEEWCADDGVRSQYMWWHCGQNMTIANNPVGGLLPNLFGLHDMSGNVSEWCEDWWHDDYVGAPVDGSPWIVPSTSARIARGSGYYAIECRSASRGACSPWGRLESVGFRLASDQGEGEGEGEGEPALITVPNVVGMTQSAAQVAITGSGLVVGAVTEQYHATVPAGQVLSQNPASGVSVATESAVALVVSLGPEMVTVPNVVGMTESEAQTAVTGAGLVVGTVTEQYHATVPAGQVISQNPASGTSVTAGSAVALVVSLGLEMVTVPNVVGMIQSAAQAAITGAGLLVGTVTQQYHATIPAGQVISQNPAAGASVASGTAVNLVVSRGPQPVAVPDVVDMARVAAEAAITAVGLTVGTVTEDFSVTVPAGLVISQNPVAGTNVASGTAVNLVVSSGPFVGETVTILLPGNMPLELVQIPAGSFQMGAPETERGNWGSEDLVHTVTIGYDFYMGKYEVTQGQWLAVMGSWPGEEAPSSTYGAGADYPAYNVSWDDAQAFITAVNVHITATGQGSATMRLPSESEWEYACRAGTQTRFYFGDSLGVADYCEDDGVRSQYMWYCGNNADYGSKPVGGLLPNGLGLYDMSGNVYEWCEDWFHDDYTGAPSDGSAWVSPSATARVVRGGSWYYGAQDCRSANRYYEDPSGRYDIIGFRLVSVQGDDEPFQVTVPNVVGMTQITAHSAIFGAGLLVGTVTQQHHATIPAGQVISQNPASGASVASGSTVALVVSLGPETVTVPDVVGMTQSEAQTATTGAGLVVGAVTEQYNAMVPAGQVISQNPAAGADVVLGSMVDLVVSCGPWDGDDTVTILLPGDVPLELVRIPAGSFQMGAPFTELFRLSAEGPVHTVTIGYDFYMGKCEVTQGQWLAVMGTNPGGNTWDSGSGLDYPAYYVSWEDTQAFVTALNSHITATGQGPATLRLPSEAEWEYACRAGTQTRFYFGDSLDEEDYYDALCWDDSVRSQYMWYCGNTGIYGEPGCGTRPVGGLLPNGFGLHDMSGNVMEWCGDWFHDDYTGAPTDGSAWVSPPGSYRVFRGGSWANRTQYCRSASRGYNTPSYGGSGAGFRLASVR